MPQYYFHLRANGTIYSDREGTELHGFAAAREHAMTVAEELMRNSGAHTRHWAMRVEDEWAEPLFDMFFADVDPTVELSPRPACLPAKRVGGRRKCWRNVHQ